MDLHLKGDTVKADYFDVVPSGNDAVWAVDDNGDPTAEHTYWTGFRPRSGFGLMFETKRPVE